MRNPTHIELSPSNTIGQYSVLLCGVGWVEWLNSSSSLENASSGAFARYPALPQMALREAYPGQFEACFCGSGNSYIMCHAQK